MAAVTLSGSSLLRAVAGTPYASSPAFSWLPLAAVAFSGASRPCRSTQRYRAKAGVRNCSHTPSRPLVTMPAMCRSSTGKTAVASRPKQSSHSTRRAAAVVKGLPSAPKSAACLSVGVATSTSTPFCNTTVCNREGNNGDKDGYRNDGEE